MEKEILTRMGTGQRVKMSAAQVKEDILAGMKDAADRGSIPELPPAELEQIFDIIADKNRVVGVEPGQEVVLSDDVTNFRMSDDEGANDPQNEVSRSQTVRGREAEDCTGGSG